MIGWLEMAPEGAAWVTNQVMVRAVLVLGAAWSASWVLRGWSAAGRHAIWLLALGALVAGPALELGMWALRPAQPGAVVSPAVHAVAPAGAQAAFSDARAATPGEGG